MRIGVKLLKTRREWLGWSNVDPGTGDGDGGRGCGWVTGGLLRSVNVQTGVNGELTETDWEVGPWRAVLADKRRLGSSGQSSQ